MPGSRPARAAELDAQPSVGRTPLNHVLPGGLGESSAAGAVDPATACSAEAVTPTCCCWLNQLGRWLVPLAVSSAPGGERAAREVVEALRREGARDGEGLY